MWNSLFWGEMSCRYQLGLTGPLYHLKLCANFLFSWSIHRCEWGVKVSQYYCVTVNFPFHTCKHLPCILQCSYFGCIYIYNCYIFFLDRSFDHYVVSFFVSSHGLYFKVYFIWYEYCYSCFIWSPFAWNFFFQPLTFSLYVSLGLRWVSCRQHI